MTGQGNSICSAPTSSPTSAPASSDSKLDVIVFSSLAAVDFPIPCEKTRSSNRANVYWGVVWSKWTTNKGTGKSIWTYILRGGDLIVKLSEIITKVTFGKGLTF